MAGSRKNVSGGDGDVMLRLGVTAVVTMVVLVVVVQRHPW